MSRKHRKSKSTKAKSTRRRPRRKKKSKLFAALVIEVISAVALFGAYRFAQDVRSTNRSERPQPTQTEQVHSPSPWAEFASAAPAAAPVETSDQAPVFRPSRLVGFALDSS